MTQTESDSKTVFPFSLILPCGSERAKKRFNTFIVDSDAGITNRIFDFNKMIFFSNNQNFNKDAPSLIGKFNTVLDEITHNG